MYLWKALNTHCMTCFKSMHENAQGSRVEVSYPQTKGEDVILRSGVEMRSRGTILHAGI